MPDRTTLAAVTGREEYSVERLATPEVIRDPYPAYAALRADSPVPGYTDYLHGTVPGVDEPARAWALLTYEHVAGALRDHQTFSSFDPIQAASTGPTLMLGNTDQPLHTKQRKIVNKAFTRGRVADMRPWIEARAADLVARLPVGEPTEVVHTVCAEFPASVMCRFLGTPDGDAPRFRKWTTAFMLTADMPAEERMASNQELGAYFAERVQDRATALAAGEEPAPGLIDALLLAEADGQKLPHDDVLNMCITLMIAGSETTMYYFGNLFHSLVAYPEAVARMRADRSLLRGFIQETMRMTGPPQRLFRIATRDVDLGGKTIAQGDWVAVFFAAANRDPEMFPDPDRFDIERSNASKHLSLGLGIHYCLGAPLADLEAECLVGALLDRFPRIEAGPEPEAQTATLLTYGLAQLPIVLHKGA